ncbi:UDP-N-acetylmuramoyl-tripeptide--D-alanyl-D-alanine ligase [Variovorax boronicumulans]|uniref:Mur ligase family protein n=1 Tax=Variovorax boronicumulans TaxID=436515 RepID=UPI00247618F2|nr:Mur ligase family protein [Variovorax boronicumulans]MDH6165787.1 UDP-N-acetylmuramoyl-tripeptide--D-alanyl-D-alanine ligase [Variovorax boronicumulans]
MSLSDLLDDTGPVVAWAGKLNLGGRQHQRTQEIGLAAVLGGVPALARADLGIALLAQRQARPEMLRLLVEAGIDVVATATSPDGDFGDEHRAERAALLDAAGIGHTGSGPTLEAALTPALRRAGHLQVALFAIDATAPGLAAGEATSGNAHLPLSSPADWTACFAHRIAAAREKAHVVLVAVHWGGEDQAWPKADQVDVGHALIDAGADAVLGAAVHGQQGVEVYRDRPIVHGAGDFLCDSLHREAPSAVFSLHLHADGVRQVVFTPVATGFGQTVELEGERAAQAASRFLLQSQALGSAFVQTATGACRLDLRPPQRPPVRLPTLPRAGFRQEAIREAAAPREEWLAASVPRAARFASPLQLGPLRLLGAQATPDRLTGRGTLVVESFWQLDQPTDVDWRIELCAQASTCIDVPAWGLLSDHDPCGWMWPTSRWQPGLVYRDVHPIEAPVAALLHDAELQIEVGLLSRTAQVERARVPVHVKFIAHAGLTTPAPARVFPPVPQYRVIPADALPPDLPGATGQTWNAAQLLAVTGGRWLVAPPPGWFVRSLPRGEQLMEMLQEPSLFVASDYWTLAIHERFPVNGDERNWDWSEEIARLQPSLAGAILRKPVPGLAPDFPVLLVDDPIHALIELGVAARERLQGHVVAVTGSAGKTSVCHMLDHAFSGSHGLFSTIQNYNSRVGMLAMLANVPAQTDLVILEVAVSAINSAGFQNIKLVRPDVAVITNITASHLDEGGKVEDVARRKANVFEGMRPGAWAVLCTDTEHFDYLVARAQARSLRVLTYGSTAAADFRLEAYDAASGAIEASHAGQRFGYVLGAKGRHMAVNSLVCFAVAHVLALDARHVPEELASFAAVEGRGQVLSFALGDRRVRVIDESYNANPLSMAAALASMADEPCEGGRKILVLGDMLELGDDAERYHQALAAPIAQCAPALVFLLGDRMSRQRDRFAAALPSAATVQACASLEVLERGLIDALRSGDLVLLKSSNGMRLWQIVRTLARLQEEQKAQPPTPVMPAMPAMPVVPAMPLPPAAVIRHRGAAAVTKPAAPSWILYDLTGDRLLTHQPASHPYVPASLAKLMTAVLVEQKLEAGQLDRHTEPVPVPAEPEPAGSDPSASFYRGVATQPVQRLLNAALVVSSDKAALTLAAWHSGRVDAFVDAMNRQARAWGMTDTHFACPAGIETAARTTAVDMLVMARRVLQEFPAVLGTAGKAQLDGVTPSAPSTNLLLGQVAGIDGLKTGTLPDGGSHLIATAQRDGRRLVSVVLGAEDRRVCAQLSALLLQRGFETPRERPAA